MRVYISYGYNYFVRFKTHDVPCSTLSAANIWIRCTIDQSDPLKILSQNLLPAINIELLLVSTNNLTLPSKFFIDEHNNSIEYSKYLSIINHYNIMLFDATQNFQLKQINILTDTFIHIYSTKIYFILHNCGHPVLRIEPNTFRNSKAKQIFVTYNNRNRTVLLKDYFSDECLIDENLTFKKENDYELIKFIEFNFFNRGKRITLTKFIFNGIIFTITILITCILICLTVKKAAKLKTASLIYDIIQTNTTYTALTLNELSTSATSHNS